MRPCLLAGLAALVFVASWAIAQAWQATNQMRQAAAAVAIAKEQVVTGDYDAVPATFSEIRRHAASARAATQDPVLRLAERVPLLGRNLAVLRELTEVVDDTLAAAEPMADLVPKFSAESLAPQDGKIPLGPLTHAAEVVTGVADGVTAAQEDLAGIDTAGTVPQLGAAHTQLSEVLNQLAPALQDAAPVVKRIPAMLAAGGSRTYVVMFLNNAELRSLGGTALSFAEIDVADGAISLARVVPATDPAFLQHTASIIPIRGGFDDSVYPGAVGRFIANATTRPSAETAAQVVQAEWRSAFGKEIDGVVSMDGRALAYALTALGPITLSTGDVVTSDNVVSLLFNQVYVRYNSGDILADDAAQGAVYAETVLLTFARLTSGQFDPATLFSGLASAVQGANLTVWLADGDERAALERTGAGAVGLPVSTPTTDAAGVYINDQVGSKLNFYLGSSLTTGSAVCTPDGRVVHRETLTLTNKLPPEAVAGLSPSIAGLGHADLGIPTGTQRLLLFFYLPVKAATVGARVDGSPVELVEPIYDEGREVLALSVQVPPGETQEVTVDFLMDEPGQRQLVTAVTPTSDGTLRQAEPLSCDSVILR
ncbi:DUF4012 domain-containing protein [Cellulomonas humilata]|uniref:DUF4012 domain-containing protein n=1 Tax=Cellulomonas humilata TaxID=144055 RepID=A0ABU0EGR0_9CELL|nr:DUF4012 domain-containing protein [Cellulomonas humilata]MDQ0374230.1 hypothetical protein [Cellulomonas humilata]